MIPASQGWGFLDLTASRPGWGLLSTPPVARVDGRPVRINWGSNNIIPVPPGRRRLEVEVFTARGPIGVATMLVDVPSGQTVALYYITPYGAATGVMGVRAFSSGGRATITGIRVALAGAFGLLAVGLMIGIVVWALGR